MLKPSDLNMVSPTLTIAQSRFLHKLTLMVLTPWCSAMVSKLTKSVL
jgi:hypothetical protein